MSIPDGDPGGISVRCTSIPGGDPDREFLSRVIEVCEAPVDEAELSLVMIYQHVARLDVTVHDAMAVAVVQGLTRGESWLEP